MIKMYMLLRVKTNWPNSSTRFDNRYMLKQVFKATNSTCCMHNSKDISADFVQYNSVISTFLPVWINLKS